MKLKHTKVATFAATIITFGALIGGANGAVTVQGNPQVNANVQFTQDINWSITTSGFVTIVVLDEAMSTPDGTFSLAPLGGGAITNINTGETSFLNFFADGNFQSGDITTDDSVFFVNTPLTASIGDIVRVSATSPISFSFATFDVDWQDSSFLGNTFLSDGSANRMSTIVSVPEPSSALFLGGVLLGFFVHRNRT